MNNGRDPSITDDVCQEDAGFLETYLNVSRGPGHGGNVLKSSFRYQIPAGKSSG